ncbi:MAG: hypothetical protein HFF05_06265 [Oscillospiraceae bacterium]|nr:hypothetical protein [Oscillospiraceae bacterium]
MNKLRPFTKRIPAAEQANFSGGSKFSNGDTIMARITPCLENGKTAFVDILAPDEIAFGSTEFIVMRAKSGVSDPQFVYYLATSPAFRSVAIQSMVGSSGRQRVQQSVLNELKLTVPPLREQRKIGAFLAGLDQKIDVNYKISKNLEQQAKLLVKSWLVDYEPFGGVMPDDWEPISLASIADFIPGYSYKRAQLQPSNVAMATIKNFDRDGGFKLDGFKPLVPSSKIKPCHYVEKFDTVVALTDLTQKADVIGNAEPIISLAGYDSIVFSLDLVKVVPKSAKISKFILAAILQSPGFKSHCMGYVNGTTVLHLSKKALPDYILNLPADTTVLKPLDNALQALYEGMANAVEESRKLRELRDSLLPRFLSGEIDLSAVEL